MHSRNCVLSHPDAASAETVLLIGLTCPSGDISVSRNDGAQSSEQPPVVNTVRVRENGPLAIEVDLQLRGEPPGRVRPTLCRCGYSKAKPFCDGAHSAAGFAATGEPPAKDAPALEARGGAVDLHPQPNGPLKITGNLEVVSGTGRTVNKVRQAFFCRCGALQNKPYCDGSHKAAGFVAE